jgi:hypothetical protein
MEVVRGMGERYLWTDAICIVQDNQCEKQELISKMDIIYTNAVMTIVAAEGKNAQAGLPGARPNSRIAQKVCIYGEGLTLYYPRAPIGPTIKSSPWSKRGWTFQEAELSPRLLIFTNDTVHFACACTTWSEDMNCESERSPPPWNDGQTPQFTLRSGLIDLMDNAIADGMPVAPEFAESQGSGSSSHSEEDVEPDDSASAGESANESDSGVVSEGTPVVHEDDDPLLSFWTDIVEELAGRKLTVETDILFATQGIFNLLQDFYGVSFIYGSPELALEKSLLWLPNNPGSLRRRTDAFGNAFNPSWSWSGWVGGVIWRWDQGPASLLADEPVIELSKLQSADGTPVPLCRDKDKGLLSRGSGVRRHSGVEERSSVNTFPFLLLTTRSSSFRISDEKFGPHVGHDPRYYGGRNFQWTFVIDKNFFDTSVFCINPCDDPKTVVGFVIEDSAGSIDSKVVEFVIVSEKPRGVFGQEQRKISIRSVYDVLAIQRKGNVAERIGYGRILEDAWLESGWRREKVILG